MANELSRLIGSDSRIRHPDDPAYRHKILGALNAGIQSGADFVLFLPLLCMRRSAPAARLKQMTVFPTGVKRL
jgi:hypothetical protein